jgi:hypothetical protein
MQLPSCHFPLASALIYCKLCFPRTAYDVSLNDDSWPQEAFELVSGSTSKIVEKLEPSVHFLIHFILPFLCHWFALMMYLLFLQRFYCIPQLCLGDQGAGQVSGFSCSYQIPCPHKGCTSGLFVLHGLSFFSTSVFPAW